MTAAQTKKYWRVWGRVRTTLTTLGEYSKADADAERAQIHQDALGKAKSSKDLTNADFDKILDLFEAILVIMDGPRTTERATTQPAARLIWAIDQLGLEEPYIASIAFDQFKTPYWRTLTEAQLTRFRFTLGRAARARAARKKS